MHILSPLLAVIGLLAGVAAVGTVFYVVMYGYKYAHPRDHQNPDWMVVLLRLYKPHVIAYFVLLTVSVAALLLAEFVKKYAS